METENEEIARISGAHELGLAFVRSSILLNGGAFVVLLGYMATATEEAQVVISLGGLKFALGFFLFGIVSVMTALGVSYVYTALNNLSPIKHSLDTKIIPLNAILCALSLGFFIAGVLILIFTTSAPV